MQLNKNTIYVIGAAYANHIEYLCDNKEEVDKHYDIIKRSSKYNCEIYTLDEFIKDAVKIAVEDSRDISYEFSGGNFS